MATRILQNAPATLEHSFYVDEVLTDPDANAVTVGITAADGSTVVAAGTAATRVSVGKYRYTLAPQVNLNHLTVRWTATFGGASVVQTDLVEVVGGFVVSLAEIRALPSLADTARHTTAELVAARTWFEDLAERYCGVAFVPRFRRVALSGDSAGELLLPDLHPRTVRSVRTYSTATIFTSYTASELADLRLSAAGVLRRVTGGYFSAGAGNIVVEYEHGMDAPPEPLRHAALIAIRAHLQLDQVGRPVLSVADAAGGTTRFALPGPDRPTGIPDVDVILNQYAGRAGAGSLTIA